MDNLILRDLNYGVYVIGCKDGERNVGCIANSVMQITSNPATIAISINHENYTNECIKRTSKFSISILNEESNSKIISVFGFSSSRNTDKFEYFEHEDLDNLPTIKDSNGYISCEVIGTLEAETHTIFLGKIISCIKTMDKPAMTYKFYHEVLKGNSPKTAPTYLPENEKNNVENNIENNIAQEIKQNRWKCSICGYIYEGTELPLDFKCPLCGAPYEMFVKETE